MTYTRQSDCVAVLLQHRSGDAADAALYTNGAFGQTNSPPIPAGTEILWIKIMVNTPPLENWEILAALGIDPDTLPREIDAGDQLAPAPPIPNTSVSKYKPLSDDEWAAIEPHIPKIPVPKPGSDFDDRTFVNAALWHIAAKSRGFGWGYLPDELGPQSSRSGRFRRWCLLAYWEALALALKGDSRLTEARREAFDKIAAESTLRRAGLLARRKRVAE